MDELYAKLTEVCDRFGCFDLPPLVMLEEVLQPYVDSREALKGLEGLCWNHILSYHFGHKQWFVSRCASVMNGPVTYYDTPLAAVRAAEEAKGHE